MKLILLLLSFFVVSCSHNVSENPDFPTGYRVGSFYRTKQPLILRLPIDPSSSEPPSLYRLGDSRITQNPKMFFNFREFSDHIIPIGTVLKVVSVRNTVTSLNGDEIIVIGKTSPFSLWATPIRLERLDQDGGAFKMAKRDPSLLEEMY